MTSTYVDHMAPTCPQHTPHPTWPHLCNCDTCTAAAAAIDLRDLGFDLADLGPLDRRNTELHPAFNKAYLQSASFRLIVHGAEHPRADPLAGWPVALRWDATPPADKFELLATIEPRFERSYRRDRRDLRDKSDSSYDFSLAYHAFTVAWTCQEVADLLIAFRRDHDDPTRSNKALRRDYTERTLINALLSVARRL